MHPRTKPIFATKKTRLQPAVRHRGKTKETRFSPEVERHQGLVSFLTLQPFTFLQSRFSPAEVSGYRQREVYYRQNLTRRNRGRSPSALNLQTVQRFLRPSRQTIPVSSLTVLSLFALPTPGLWPDLDAESAEKSVPGATFLQTTLRRSRT